jgi:CHAT domain-containing protein/Tfp pilus assembly protein PilF
MSPFFREAGQLIDRGNGYLDKGHNFWNVGKNSRALKMYDKAYPLYVKARDPKGQGNVYLAKGHIYKRAGDNLKAIEMYDEALHFYEKARDPIGLGNGYLSKGRIYFFMGNYSNAFELFDKALTFFKKAMDFINQGNVYLGKGDIYKRAGDNLKALEMYNKALTFFKKAGQQIGQGNVYHSKGDIYSRIGKNSMALKMFEKALPFFEKTGYHVSQVNVCLGKGYIYSGIGENSLALDMYDKALPFFEKARQQIGRGNVYLGKGYIYLNNGSQSRALEMYEKALPFFEKVGYPIGQGNVYLSKGAIYLYTGNKNNALEMFNKALFFYKKSGDIYSESNALCGKAKVLEKMGKKDEALDLFEKGIAKLEKVRMQTVFPEMKKNFMGTCYKQYIEAVIFMLENKYDEKGFKYSESMRARVFLDQMAEGLVKLEKGLKPELKEKRDNQAAKLSLLSKQIHQTHGGEEEKKLLELKEQYRKTGREFEDLLVKIRLNNPLYASVRYPEPITVPALQTEVLKKGEILVQYLITPDKLYVFLISKESFEVIPIKLKEKEIKSITRRYLQVVGENDSNGITRYGKILYQKLFKPLELSLKNNNTIIIVPDGELARIPFEALILDREKSGQPVYLLGKYHIKYVQSATLLSVLRKHYRRNKETKSFVGIGDPVYDYGNFKQGKLEQGTLIRSPGKGSEIRAINRSRYTRAGGIMKRLPHSGEEVSSIGRLFEKMKQKWVVYLRDQASEEKAKASEMKDFDFIHFACHGLLNDEFQGLLLSQLPADKYKEDGYLTLNEIMNCDFNAKLVVLSACQTGSGKLVKGEGVTGLTRAVMYAGTPAVIASLRNVDDTATKELMVKFYRNMLEKDLDKTEALRQAKLELLKNEKYRSPLYWSAFVMYGE